MADIPPQEIHEDYDTCKNCGKVIQFNADDDTVSDEGTYIDSQGNPTCGEDDTPHEKK